MAAGFEQLVVRLNRPWLLPALVSGGLLLAALSFLAGFLLGSDYFASQMNASRQIKMIGANSIFIGFSGWPNVRSAPSPHENEHGENGHARTEYDVANGRARSGLRAFAAIRRFLL